MKFGKKKDEGSEGMKEKYGADDDNEYDEYGEMSKGGGYFKKAGKLCSMNKSDDVDYDDLQKSLDMLEDFATSEDGATRKEYLLGCAGSGSLTKSEKAELFQILGGQSMMEDDGPDLGDRISKSFTDNEPLQKAVDVSGYLQENQEALVKSLHSVGDAIEASDNRRHEFAILQAKTLVDIGNMVKSMSEVVEQLAGQPIGAPKSRGVRVDGRALNKSFGGQPPSGEALSKSMVMDGLDALMADSMEKGMGGRLSSTNEDISLAVSKFETSGQISPTMLEAVKGLRGAGTGASH